MTPIKWHPYPANKPRRRGFYLVTVKGDPDTTVPDVSYYSTHLDCFGRSLIFCQYPIAWAKLPEPYDPEGDVDESGD